MMKGKNPLMIEKSFARTKLKGKDRDSKKKSVVRGPKVENGSTCGMAEAKGTRVKGKVFPLWYDRTLEKEFSRSSV